MLDAFKPVSRPKSILSFITHGFIVAASLSATFALAGLSNNPDDFDVSKYTQLYNNSGAQLNQANSNYQNAIQQQQNAQLRFNRAEADLSNRQNELRSNRERSVQGYNAIRAWSRDMDNVQVTVNNLQNTSIPPVLQLLEIDRQVLQQMQLGFAQMNQAALAQDLISRSKRDAANGVAHLAQQKKNAFDTLNAQVSFLQNKLQSDLNQQLQYQNDLNLASEQLAPLTQKIAADEAALAPQLVQQQAQLKNLNDLLAQKQVERRAILAKYAVLPRSRLPEFAVEIQAKDREITSVNNQVKTVSTSLEGPKSVIAEEKAHAAGLSKRKAAAEQQLPAIVAIAATDQQNLAVVLPQLPVAKQALDSANAAAAPALADAQASEVIAADLHGKAFQLASVRDSQGRKVNEEQNHFNQLQAQLQNLTNRILQDRSDIGNEQENQRKLEMIYPQLQQNVQYAIQNLRNSESLLVLSNQNLQDSASMAAQAKNNNSFYTSRLNEVNSNLQQGLNLAQANADQDAGSDAFPAGSDMGRSNGIQVGIADGEKSGTTNGTSEGRLAARDAGTADGSNVGNLDGLAQGKQDGTAKAQIDGPIDGRAKGLADGYQAGKDEGTSTAILAGTQAGKAMQGYETGRATGYAHGLSQAKSEAHKQGFPVGTKTADNEIYNGTLAQSTTSNTLVVNPAGSAKFDQFQWEQTQYYRPRRSYIVLPITRAYTEEYRSQFYRMAANSYELAYKAAYADNYSRSYKSSHDLALKADFSADRANAYNQAYNSAKTQVYQPTFEQFYTSVKQPLFDIAYQNALPERHEEGRKETYGPTFETTQAATYQAELDRGNSEGDQAGYGENFSKLYATEVKAGYNEKMAFFKANAVLEYDGVVLTNVADDGIFPPAEAVSLNIAMKNFGKVSQKDPVTVTLSDASANIVFDKKSTMLVPLAGATRTLLTGVAPFKVSASAPVGSAEQLTVTVSQSGKSLGSATVEFKVAYPLVMSSLKTAEFVVPATDNTLTIGITNNSTKNTSPDLKVKLISKDGLATITTVATNGQLTLGELASGATSVANFTFTFKDEDAFKKLNFEAQIMDGARVLGKSNFQVDTAKRWVFSDNSSGLIIVPNNEVRKSVELHKFSNLHYDYWNVKLEGQPTEATLTQYAGKTVLISTVKDGYLTQEGTTALGSYLTLGGKLFMGGSDDGMMDTFVAQWSKGLRTTDFMGLKMTSGNAFKAKDPKYMIFVGPDLTGERSLDIENGLLDFDAGSKSFQEQLNIYAVASQNAGSDSIASLLKTTYAISIVALLQKEMSDDATSTHDHYARHANQTKLTAFVNTALSKQGAASAGFIELVAQIESSLGENLSSNNYNAAMKTLRPLER